MTTTTATARVDVSQTVIGDISPLIFGGMIEHFGRTVYPGVWDVDRDVPRADTKAAIEAMGVRALRYPGGCFSSDYHWRDGVGPKEERPLIESSFWTTVHERAEGFGADSGLATGPEGIGPIIGPPEPNLMGTDEFLQYCLDVDAEPFLVANIGTGTIDEAAAWVRYCNVDRKAPRTVTWWGIGNETWGLHEYGHAPPSEYGARVVEFAEAMRAVDPSIKLVAVGLPVAEYEVMGGDGGGLARHTAREWNRDLLEVCGQHIDALSVHWYFPGMIGRPLDTADDLRQLLTAPDMLADALAATATFNDEVVPARRIDLSLDEWNRMVEFKDHLSANHPLADGAFFAGCYNAMLANAGRVRIAIVSHLVNCLAPIQTDDSRLFVTSGYLVAQLYERYARGQSVAVDVESPSLDVPPMDRLDGARWPAKPLRCARTAAQLAAAAARDGDVTTVFLANRDPEASLVVDVHGLPDGRSRLRRLDGPGIWAQNSLDHPDVLRLREAEVETIDGVATVSVPAAGVAVLITGTRR